MVTFDADILCPRLAWLRGGEEGDHDSPGAVTGVGATAAILMICYK